jgi:hypothetical protein
MDLLVAEMRNPLSAMVQCADSIYSSLNEMKALVHEDALPSYAAIQTQLKGLITTSLDAVDTIQACATHQKRIGKFRWYELHVRHVLTSYVHLC